MPEQETATAIADNVISVIATFVLTFLVVGTVTEGCTNRQWERRMVHHSLGTYDANGHFKLNADRTEKD